MFTKIRMREEKGFTLIELLIVVAIIGILAAIAIPQFAQYRRRGYIASAKSDLKNAYTSAQAYLTDHPTTPNVVMVSNQIPGGAFRASTGNTLSGTMAITSGSFTVTNTQIGTAATNIGTIDSTGQLTSPQ